MSNDRCPKCGGATTDDDLACILCGSPHYLSEPFLEVVNGPSDGLGRTVGAAGVTITATKFGVQIVAEEEGTPGAVRVRLAGDACVVEARPANGGALVDGRLVDGTEQGWGTGASSRSATHAARLRLHRPGQKGLGR